MPSAERPEGTTSLPSVTLEVWALASERAAYTETTFADDSVHVGLLPDAGARAAPGETPARAPAAEEGAAHTRRGSRSRRHAASLQRAFAALRDLPFPCMRGVLRSTAV